ncbi:MAG: Maf family protein [Clostridia bacterium]
MEKQNKRIILASSSPRREELCKQAFAEVLILPQNVEEYTIYRQPWRIVTDLAEKKINNLNERFPDDFVVGADTIVVLEKTIFGKPHTIERAIEYLELLQGNWHTVYTGVCVWHRGQKRVFFAKSFVKFNRMNAEQIASYVERKMPLDKAGAYGIQDKEVVEKYIGSYSNIVGLPMEKLVENIAEMEKICKK